MSRWCFLTLFRPLPALALLISSHAALALPPPFADGLEGPPAPRPVLPSRLSPETRYYRGMNERQASLVQVLGMIAGTNTSVIPSRRLSTLKKLHPEATEAQLMAQVDADLESWRSSGQWFAIADCHSDSFDCPVSDFETLRGSSFPDLSFLPDELKDRARFWPHSNEPWRLLQPLDPVISTSIDLRVARAFTGRAAQEDPGAPASYTLILNDSRMRNCPEPYRAPAEICIIENTEYADESEMPFWNYILPIEIDALERGVIRVRRGHGPGTLKLSTIDPASPGANGERPLPSSCLSPAGSVLSSACPVPIDSKLREAIRSSALRLER